MKTSMRLASFLLIASIVILVACREEDQTQPPGNNGGGEVPPGMARLYGSITDTAGQSVAGVALHVYYPVAGEPGDPVLIGSDILLFDTAQVLTTECGGGTPLPDGIPVKIYWDANNNGVADPDDPQPPVCTDPPNCAGMVNYNEFPVNGGQSGLPGMFIVENDFNVIGDVLSPNRFYLRIFCTDGNVLWTSEMVDVPEGPSEYGFHLFACTPCNGIPEIPIWRLDPAYPNPTVDSAVVPFALEQSASALITLRQQSNGRTDTLLNQTTSPGEHTLTVQLGDRANGLYECRYFAGSFAQTDLLLKNESNHSVLRVIPEISLTQGDGSYRFDTAAGVSINRRGTDNQNLGTLPLDHVRIIALKAGYQDLDTTVAISSAESLRVDLTLQPQ